MRKLLSGICATALAAAFAVSSVVPVNAAPIFAPRAQAVQPQSDVIQIQDGFNYIMRLWRGNRNWNGNNFNRNWSGNNFGNYRNFRRGGNYAAVRRGGNYGWYNGYRGYPYRRYGYRYHNGFANSNNYYPRYAGSAHERWCYSRYRSYRAWDNTFQPYNGPRRPCYSPYGG